MARKPTKKQQLYAEGIAQGKNRLQAALDAGYSPTSARTLPYVNSDKSAFRQRTEKLIEARQKAAIEAAQIHTDEITGTLVQMARGSIADVLPTNKLLKKARKRGVDGLIKKVHIRYKKVGDRTLPDGTKEPIIKEEIDIELYSRLDAISQLRDNFGMKQEPRANTYEDTRRQEVEKHLDRIAQLDNVDRSEAAKRLKAALPDDSPLIPTINKYVN